MVGQSPGCFKSWLHLTIKDIFRTVWVENPNPGAKHWHRKNQEEPCIKTTDPSGRPNIKYSNDQSDPLPRALAGSLIMKWKDLINNVALPWNLPGSLHVESCTLVSRRKEGRDIIVEGVINHASCSQAFTCSMKNTRMRTTTWNEMLHASSLITCYVANKSPT